jgi:hypothetical protein
VTLADGAISWNSAQPYATTPHIGVTISPEIACRERFGRADIVAEPVPLL